MSFKRTYKCPNCGQETDKSPFYENRFYHKSGDHPIILEYNLYLDSFSVRAKELESLISEAQRAEAEPTAKYGNLKVQVVQEGEIWHDDSSPMIEKVAITRYLLNRDERDAWMARWGSIMGSWRETESSVYYYRTKDGILTHEGGYLILKTPQLISEEEFSQLKQGNIPERLIK